MTQDTPSEEEEEVVADAAYESSFLATGPGVDEGWDEAACLGTALDSSDDELQPEDEGDDTIPVAGGEGDRGADGWGLAEVGAHGVGDGDGVMAGMPNAGGGGVGAGAEGPAPAPPPPPPAVVDLCDGWYLPEVDDSVGRVPACDTVSTRFLVQHIPHDLPTSPGRGSALTMFRAIWDADVVNMMLTFTNERLRRRRADELSEAELWRWLALTLTMGVAKQPTLESYWSTTHFGACVSHCMSLWRRWHAASVLRTR